MCYDLANINQTLVQVRLSSDGLLNSKRKIQLSTHLALSMHIIKKVANVKITDLEHKNMLRLMVSSEFMVKEKEGASFLKGMTNFIRVSVGLSKSRNSIKERAEIFTIAVFSLLKALVRTLR